MNSARQSMFAGAMLLLGGVASAEWTLPVLLPTDTLNAGWPVTVAVGDDQLWAAYVAQPSGPTVGRIQGNFYDGTGWSPAQALAPDSLCEVTGYSLARDSAQQAMIAYYSHDHWGICTATLESNGSGPPEMAWRDSARLNAGSVSLQVSATGWPGIAWASPEGVRLSAIWFIMRSESGWAKPQLVDEGVNSPPLHVTVCEPRLATDTGDRFFISYDHYYEFEPQSGSQVFVRSWPDGTQLGSLPGRNSRLVSDPVSQRLWLAYMARPADADLLGTQFYTSARGWSPLMVADSNTDGISFSLAVDRAGAMCLAYVTAQGIVARYAADTTWSAPELVHDETGVRGLSVSVDNRGLPWILWEKDSAASRRRIWASHRTSRPGVRAGANTQSSQLRLQVSPTVAGSGFRIRVRGTLLARPRLSILNALGRRVRTVSGDRWTDAVWDGTDEGRRLLPAGLYYCCLKAGPELLCAKLVLQR